MFAALRRKWREGNLARMPDLKAVQEAVQEAVREPGLWILDSGFWILDVGAG